MDIKSTEVTLELVIFSMFLTDFGMIKKIE